ncbi:MAG: hypothetical protein ABIM83_07855 [candidate division WOR-3 bacterium]
MKLKDFFKSKYFPVSIIFLIVCFFSLYRYFTIVTKTGGVFLFPTDDSYVTLCYSVQMGKGYPFKFNDNEPSAPMEPSFLAQIFYSLVYRFFTKTPEGFSSFIFLINMLFLFLTLIFIFYIFKISTNDNFISFLSILMLSLFMPFRYIFILGMGHSFLTFFFYLTIIFFLLRKEIFFFLSGIFLALSRPESVFIFLIFLIYFFIRKKKKFIIYNFILILIWLIPSIIYFIISRTFLPTGIYPQSLFFVYSKPAVFSSLIEYLRDYLLGVFLGFYPSLWESKNIEFYSSQLPFCFLIFCFFGIFYKKTFSNETSKEFIIISFLNFLIFWIISGLTVFAGVHLLRHTVWLFPFIFLLGILGIDFLVKKFKNFPWIKYILYGFYLLIPLFQSIDFENKNIFITIHKVYPHYMASKWIKNNIGEGEFISLRSATLKFFTGRRIYSFSFGENWRALRFSKFHYPSHYFELLKYYFKKDGEYYIYWDATDEEVPWFSNFEFLADSIVYYHQTISGNHVKIGKVGINKILDGKKIYAETLYTVIDYIDVGDPLSERVHKYSFSLYEPLIKIRPFPIRGKMNGKEFLEGGIFSKFEKFNFYIKEKEIEKIYLVGRIAKSLFYSSTFYNKISLNSIEIPFQQIHIYLNGNYLGVLNLKEIENFSEFVIPLSKNLLKIGKNEIIITGAHISTGYWIIKKLD